MNAGAPLGPDGGIARGREEARRGGGSFAVALVGAAVVGCYLVWNLMPRPLLIDQGDQVMLALLEKQRETPSFLAHDVLFGRKAHLLEKYPGMILTLMGGYRALGMDQVACLGATAALLAGAYFAGLYLLMRKLGVGRAWACAAAAGVALGFYPAVGGDTWTVGYGRYLLTRTPWAAAAPWWLIYHFFYGRRSWRSAFMSGLALGLLMNVHPQSSLFTGVAVGLVWAGDMLACLPRSRQADRLPCAGARRDFLKGSAFGAGFLAGALPFLGMILSPSGVQGQVSFKTWYAAAHYRILTSFPLRGWSQLAFWKGIPAGWQKFLSLVAVAGWGLTWWGWRGEKQGRGSGRWWVRAAADVCVATGACLAMGGGSHAVLILAFLPRRLEEADWRLRLYVASIVLICFPFNWAMDSLMCAVGRPFRLALELGRSARLVYPFLFMMVARSLAGLRRFVPEGKLRLSRWVYGVVAAAVFSFLQYPDLKIWLPGDILVAALGGVSLWALDRAHARGGRGRWLPLAVAGVLLWAAIPARVALSMGAELVMRIGGVGRFGVGFPEQAAFLEMCRWVQGNTSEDDLFYVSSVEDESKFRLYAERGIVHGWKDGGGYIMAYDPDLETWLKRAALVQRAKMAGHMSLLCRETYAWGARYWACPNAEAGVRPPAGVSEAVFGDALWSVYRLMPGAGGRRGEGRAEASGEHAPAGRPSGEGGP